VHGRDALGMAAPIVLPHALVEAVVEIEMFEALELASRRRKEIFRRLDMPVHRAADVEEEQDFDGVAPLGPPAHVDIAALGAAADRFVEVELLGRAFAREAAQAPERDFHGARAEGLVAVEILEVAPVPDFHGASHPALVLADAHALRVLAI